MKIYLFLVFFIAALSYSQTDIEKGELLLTQKKYTEAKFYTENYLKMNPKNYQAIELLGDIAGSQKKWDEAIRNYAILKNQMPQNANYWYKFAGAMGMKAKDSNRFRALGMLDDIEGGFLKAAKLDTNHVDARWALVVYYMEVPGILGGSEKKSLKYANELLKISPVDGYLSMGYIFEYNKNYKEAEKLYIKANEIGKSKITYQKLFDLYKNKMKMPQKAEALLMPTS